MDGFDIVARMFKQVEQNQVTPDEAAERLNEATDSISPVSRVKYKELQAHADKLAGALDVLNDFVERYQTRPHFHKTSLKIVDEYRKWKEGNK